MTIVLNDKDLGGRHVMQTAISAVEDVLFARAQGEVISPPRHHVSFSKHGDLVFTIGGMRCGQSKPRASIAGILKIVRRLLGPCSAN